MCISNIITALKYIVYQSISTLLIELYHVWRCSGLDHRRKKRERSLWWSHWSWEGLAESTSELLTEASPTVTREEDSPTVTGERPLPQSKERKTLPQSQEWETPPTVTGGEAPTVVTGEEDSPTVTGVGGLSHSHRRGSPLPR